MEAWGFFGIRGRDLTRKRSSASNQEELKLQSLVGFKSPTKRDRSHMREKEMQKMVQSWGGSQTRRRCFMCREQIERRASPHSQLLPVTHKKSNERLATENNERRYGRTKSPERSEDTHAWGGLSDNDYDGFTKMRSSRLKLRNGTSQSRSKLAGQWPRKSSLRSRR